MRTFYHGIATLQGQGANIEGEPGLGYVLRPGFTLHPLMFSTKGSKRWCSARAG